MDSIKTQVLTRDQFAEIVNGNPRAVKVIENLLKDVSLSLPDALTAVEAVANEALAAVNVFRPLVATALAIRMPRGGFGIATTNDAAGPILAVDTGQLVLGLLPFLPKPARHMMPDDAQFVISQRVFGG